MPERVLTILPTTTGIPLEDGRMLLAGRFLSGLEEFGRLWDGRLRVVLDLEPPPPGSTQDRPRGVDLTEVDPATAPFDLHMVGYDTPDFAQALRGSALTLAGMSHRQNHVPALCRSLGVPSIVCPEYTLATRLQIVRAENKNPLLRLRRSLWVLGQERQHRRALAAADGLQCVGPPSFEAYARLNPRSMWFFDGRMSEAMVVRPEVQEARLAQLRSGAPLRLAFAGRLNEMKGADHLIRVGAELARLGVECSLEIFGQGVLEESMRSELAARGLEARVRMPGFVPFEQLMAHMQSQVDLFVLCHPQGDPAGAYLETLGNGLPIVGYANEALLGLLGRAEVGRAVPIGDAAALARLIAELEGQREELARWSRCASAYAREHTFEKSFARRVEHMERVIRETREA
jgi:colanic acid/amylovoran biosynthesis glycosyltransferase